MPRAETEKIIKIKDLQKIEDLKSLLKPRKKELRNY